MGDTGGVLELFAGIGGVACAWPEAENVVAVDINRQAAAVYRANFRHRYEVLTIDEGAIERPPLSSLLTRPTWWLSPPCQPYTQRGKQRDWLDRRAEGLRACLRAIEHYRPAWLVLENVASFRQSHSRYQLQSVLERRGYHYQETLLCPAEFGWPNRRPRYYLIAGQASCRPWRPKPLYHLDVGQLVQSPSELASDGMTDLRLPEDVSHRYRDALDRCGPASLRPTACFTAAYGKTILNAGSYWLDDRSGRPGWRRFSPREVARLLGFPDTFHLAPGTPRTMWKLLGNSLSLPVVRYVLSHLPHGPEPILPWHSATGRRWRPPAGAW
ncbi:MAG: DNA methyltransferase [Pirellulaceae bacterium]|nr:MAG: DNA methyltransferase [Pirellulaceae bacterium]